MLELERIDLQDLSTALEDYSDLHSWWLDPQTGAIEVWTDELQADDESHPEDRGWLFIQPIVSSDGYADLVDFTEAVVDTRARDLLRRAIQGRGAFRRFKDTLSEFPELRDAWFEFHGVRMERRAIEWLSTGGVIDAGEAAGALATRPDANPNPNAHMDPVAVARKVAADLADLYGERLRDVRIFGSWARGDAHPESDIDILVVLDRVGSRWDERQRMEDVLWQRSFEHDIVVSAYPVGEDEFAGRDSAFIARIRAEAVALA